MIFTHAEIPVASETREEALDIVRTIAARSREEDGVIDYRATTDIENPNVIRILEQYKDMDAVDAHNASDHLETFQSEIEAHLDGDPKLYRFVVDSAAELPGP